MIQIGRKEFGISNFAIRILAVASMITAVVGYDKGHGYDWIEAFGWTSFTFFAFLLAEGVVHTTNKKLYLRRFLLFTVISEVLYTYYRSKTFWSTRYFSAMSTMFLGFIVILFVSFLKKKYDNVVLDMIALAVLGYGAYWLAETFRFDFGGYGIIIIIGFYVARVVTYTRITQAIVLFYISFFLSSNVLGFVSIGGIQYPIASELFSMIALPFIWLYNDKRGPNSIVLQLLQYLAYPIMLAVLIFYRYFL